MTLRAIPEADALKKWCPHVRETDQDCGTYNRGNLFEEVQGVRRDTGQLSPTFTCKGSMCMAWRWEDRAEGYCGFTWPINDGT